MKLLSDPRVMKLMQNEQFMKAMMAAISMPGKIDGFTKEHAEKFAKRMSLATADRGARSEAHRALARGPDRRAEARLAVSERAGGSGR